ncbi:DoxX family membrane protein [Mucilaginibacter puniceus]
MDEKKITQVQTLLKYTYGLIPIAAGADKFTNLLTDWSQYLHPSLAGILPFSSHAFMLIVGAIEIVAGILVLINPARAGYLVSAWLVLIALSLLASGKYLDVAVRDIAMAIGAYSLAQVSQAIKKTAI